jgi:hypothetical protein
MGRIDLVDLTWVCERAGVLRDTIAEYAAQPVPDAPLRDVVSSLVQRSLADSTFSAYECHWNLFFLFCKSKGWSAFPVTPELVAAFIASMVGNSRRRGQSVIQVVAAMEKLATLTGSGSVSSNALVRACVGGYIRVKPVVRDVVRAPLAPDHAQAIVGAGFAALAKGDFELAACAAAVVFNYVFMARVSTLLSQRMSDVAVASDFISVCFTFEKNWSNGGFRRNVQFRLHSPDAVVFGEHPFFFLRAYVFKCAAAAQEWLFQHDGKPWSVDRASRAWQTALEAAGVVLGSSRCYKPHSGRKGLASLAAAFGVNHTVICERAGWKSTESARSYMADIVALPRHRVFLGLFNLL